MPTPLRNLRVDDETWDAWTVAAEAEGVDVSTFIRQTVNARVAGPLLEPIESLAPVAGAGPGNGSLGAVVVTTTILPDKPASEDVKKLNRVEVAVDGKPVGKGTVRKKGPRQAPCLHRVPPESYCSRGCDG